MLANLFSLDPLRRSARWAATSSIVVARQPRHEPYPPRWLSAALLLACLALPFGLFLFKAASDRGAAIGQAERDASDAVGTFEQQALTILETGELVATLLDDNVRSLSRDKIDQPDALPRHLSGLAARYPWIGGVSLLDAKGQVRLSSLPGAGRDGQGADSEYLRTLRDQDGNGPFIGRQATPGDGGYLSIARRRTTPSGSFGGVVLVSARPSVFTDFWQRDAPQDTTLLFRADGQLLARSPPGRQDVRPATIGSLLLAAARSADRGSLVSFADIDGSKQLIAYRKIPRFPVFIAHGVSMSRVLRPWRASALRDGLFFLLAEGTLSALAFAATRHSRREADAIGLLLQRSDELASEAERRARAEADLGAVLRDMVERQEAERKHLARELHDSLGQHVAVLHMGLEGILHRAADAECLRDQVGRLKTTAKAVSMEIGRLAWELRPAGLDELGLEAALRSFVSATSWRSGLPIDLHIRLSDFRLSAAVEATLYRVVQEAVTNIIKHAGAARADIVVEVTPQRARVIIEDDGKGFVWDETGVRRPGERLGLLGVRERLSLVGGSLEIESSLGRGATLFIDVPA